jgi:hypothetical protein
VQLAFAVACIADGICGSFCIAERKREETRPETIKAGERKRLERQGRRRPARKMKGKPLTLEKYHRFFLDPWGTKVSIDQLNQVRTVKYNLSPSIPLPLIRFSSPNFSSILWVPACILIFSTLA